MALPFRAVSETRFFVPTDADGVQFYEGERFSWPLPEPDGTGGFRPGAPLRPPRGARLALRDLDSLLEDLGERIFLAEPVVGQPERPESARLLGETAWSLEAAARFALDCVDHIVGGSGDLRLPNGASVSELLAEVRGFLEEGKVEKGILHSISRLALARRLRRQGDEVADVAFGFALEDEAAGEDTFADPAWTAAAALREALLSAVEAIRHRAMPRLTEGENVVYEEEQMAGGPAPETLSTPWGNFSGGRRRGVVPAWVAAAEAAERARQAMADTSGEEAERGERAYQLRLLARALGLEETTGPAC